MLWKGQQRILLADKQVRGEPITIENFVIDTINNGDRTKWSPLGL